MAEQEHRIKIDEIKRVFDIIDKQPGNYSKRVIWIEKQLKENGFDMKLPITLRKGTEDYLFTQRKNGAK